MAMTDSDLLAIIRAHRDDSLGADNGELSGARSKAMDHYHGRPYGNEQEGRSQVVSRDLAESVDWIMPAIMRVFTHSGNIAEFTPVGPEDEDAAQQESDYVNQVIMKDNDGFIVLHDVCKDTLLLKNGYVKHYWDESERTTTEEYEGLSLEQLVQLMQQLQSDGAEVDIKGQEEKVIMSPSGPVTLYDIELQITRKKGRVLIEGVPAEEIRVSKRCRGSLQSSPFVEHVTRKTRSSLVEMGMSRDFADSLPAFTGDDNNNEVRSRDSVADESDVATGLTVDRSMDEIEFCEAYIRVDYDGDGIAELRKVVTAGGKIPKGEDWNEPIDAVPITGFVAKRFPFRHVGESLDDELEDLQKIKTALMRQLLDNVYLTNNSELVVNERVNLADLLQSLPGGIKRVQGLGPVGDSIMPLITTPVIDKILPVIDHIDAVKEMRTGINRTTTGLDPDILKQTTKGAFLENLNRASQKVEMITRMIAETGVKEMVLQVHSLLMKYQDKERIVRMRGKWVPVNPQEWRERIDLTVKVGLGTGNEEEKRDKIMLMAQGQDRLMQFGLVGPMQAYALFSDFSEALGFDMPEKYAISPDSPEYQQMMQQQQQGQSNPLAEVEQIKGQFSLQAQQMKIQFDAQVKHMEEQHKAEMEMMRLRINNENARAERASREAIEAAKLEMQAFLAGMKADLGQPGMGAGLQNGA